MAMLPGKDVVLSPSFSQRAPMPPEEKKVRVKFFSRSSLPRTVVIQSTLEQPMTRLGSALLRAS